MKRASKEFMKVAVLGVGVPAVLLLVAWSHFFAGPILPPQPSLGTTITETQSTTSVPPSTDIKIDVLIDGEVVPMELEEYVAGVVLAEMPASFHYEALKAQAVAARTYAIKTIMDGKKHAGAVCGDYRCCQGYMTAEEYLLRGWKEKYVTRVVQAVKDTAGQVLTFEGKPIRATYFSCSGGITESAVAVWGREYPYLQSVQSPGEEETVYYSDHKTFTLEDFQNALGVVLSGSPETWFGEITYTSGGGIDTIDIAQVSYKGTTLRSLLGLRSTVFCVIVNEDSITFQTKGYGHRVGMSQYGADAMATEGATYCQILEHYYIGTQLTVYE